MAEVITEEMELAREMLEFTDRSVVEPVDDLDSIESNTFGVGYQAVFRAIPNSTQGMILLHVQDGKYRVLRSGLDTGGVSFLAVASAYRRAAKFVANMCLQEMEHQ